MQYFFNFGEKVSGYDYLLINEREARASAGIMLVLGILSLFSVYIFRTLLWAELFSLTFIFEFFMRTVVNPKYAPYMLLGSLIVYNQKPEWVEAKPKRFAWVLGMILGLIMTYYILFDIISLLRLSICVVCLILLFLESSFGICLGCILYKQLNVKLNNCPGGVCEIGQKVSFPKQKLLLLALFIVGLIGLYYLLISERYTQVSKTIVILKT